jgi:hypothetical protein
MVHPCGRHRLECHQRLRVGPRGLRIDASARDILIFPRERAPETIDVYGGDRTPHALHVFCDILRVVLDIGQLLLIH